MQIWYFETSAVNYFMDIMNENDAVETKKLQLLKNRDWCISPMTLVEILQTSDFEQRDKIVRFAQRLFSDELLASPEETIIHYIKQGFPTNEPRFRLKSKSLLSEVWRDVVNNPQKQINIDAQQLKDRSKAIKSFSKLIHKVMNGDDSIIVPTSDSGAFNCSLEAMLNNMEFIKEDPPYSPEQRKIFKLAIVYMITLICCQAGTAAEVTDEFWKSLGHEKTSCRINYALENWEPLIYRGPLCTLAHMAYCQSQVKFSRGVYNDSLHAMYLNYTDFLFSSDAHFASLKQALTNTPYASRIQLISEVGFEKEQEPGQFTAEQIVT
ncbi:hypothetical protein [Vibrio cholerae]|uniref:hypothetical protein n=1 Tax=Vibrio cholerae TaxID=666 RepID=UPI0011D55122|nr:hypothetical protein [Vibrio cholerae]EJL7978751.1 hypothetical protein [Vibrio cholerae]TXZ87225.1 hypothetical protein FXE50_08555 [Vibrio cholerae]GIB82189.1 hypothetical protein VCSRO19_3549 [Vibrio cholerae]